MRAEKTRPGRRRTPTNKNRSPFVLPAVLASVVLVLLGIRLLLPVFLDREAPAPTPTPVQTAESPAPTPTPAATAPVTPTASPAPGESRPPLPTPTPTPEAKPDGEIVVPADISRELFDDCGKNADGSISPSWYPGRVDRDLETGKVTYKWDRSKGTLALLKEYGAIYRKNEDQKVAYLTFDCGYEMGYTEKILDTLKEKGVKAIFFCAGDFFDDPRAPQLIQRMVDEGHLVGNHTLHHPTMVYKSDQEFMDEINGLREKVNDILGYEYPMGFYRPPEGATNERDLYLAREMGFTTVLWSFAYYDYNPKDQMAPEKALAAAEGKLHNGCVYLLHAVSETNTAILGDLIDYIRGEGYELLRIDQ